jgi:hypothetical protein
VSGGNDPLVAFTVATFTPRVGEEFRVHHGEDQTMPTRLVEATAAGPGVHRDQFSLVFRGPPDMVLPQQIYRIDHDEMGSFELFLVPIGPDADGMRYEAVFA